MKYHLICGYKRSGKDTFFNCLLKGNLIKYIEQDKEDLESKCCFYILTKTGSKDFVSLDSYPFQESKPIKIALAEMVKEEVHSYFQIKFKTQELQELAKDNLLFFDEEKFKFRTLREYYIEHAMKLRFMDQDHWCKSAYIYMLMNSSLSKNVVITDWRFPNEKVFFEAKGDTITYRIFRSEANDDNTLDVSEHSLDNELTDFLVVGKLSDIDIAISKFPQYEGYELLYKLKSQFVTP